jgi:hypothetical protein
MVPRGVACRAVRITDQAAIAVWMLGGSRAKVATHRARKVNAMIAMRKRNGR